MLSASAGAHGCMEDCGSAVFPVGHCGSFPFFHSALDIPAQDFAFISVSPCSNAKAASDQGFLPNLFTSVSPVPRTETGSSRLSKYLLTGWVDKWVGGWMD